MAAASDAPADTTMMRVVHDAIRRDLARARAVLGRPAASRPTQHRAVGAHLGWMMRFLRAHHESEDLGLYPFVRARALDDADVEVLDRMERAHEDVAAAIAEMEEAAAALAADGSDDAGQRTLAAIDGLEAALLPHLREEEDEAMPIVSKLITAAEWQALEQEHTLDGR